MSFDLDILVFRPDRPGIRKVLGDLEAEIMEVIWTRPEDQRITVRDIFETLYARRSIAYTTVMSTMTRLAKKRVLQVEKKEHIYFYRPAMSQQAFIRLCVAHMLEEIFVSFMKETIQGIHTLPEPQLADEARTLLAEIQRRRVQEEGD